MTSETFETFTESEEMYKDDVGSLVLTSSNVLTSKRRNYQPTSCRASMSVMNFLPKHSSVEAFATFPVGLTTRKNERFFSTLRHRVIPGIFAKDEDDLNGLTHVDCESRSVPFDGSRYRQTRQEKNVA